VGKQVFDRMKRTIAILLVVCFLVSLTATAVSASTQDYKDGCKAGYKAGYDAGEKKGYADGYADGSETARELTAYKALISKEKETFSSEDYRKGYRACYPKGYENGYKKGYGDGFKDGTESV